MRCWNWESNLGFRTSNAHAHSHSSRSSQTGTSVDPGHLHGIIRYQVLPRLDLRVFLKETQNRLQSVSWPLSSELQRPWRPEAEEGPTLPPITIASGCWQMAGLGISRDRAETGSALWTEPY